MPDSESKNQGSTQRELDSFYRGNRAASGPTLRYLDESEMPRDFSGDQQAPFVKTPPFLTNIAPWVKALTLLSTYSTLDELECRDYRLLSIYFELTLGDAGGGNFASQLSIVPEARAVDAKGDSVFYGLGVVDPTVTLITAGAFGNGYGSRPFAPSELRSSAFTSVGARVVRFNLVWDVASFEAFRLNLAESTQAISDSKIDVFYQLAQ